MTAGRLPVVTATTGAPWEPVLIEALEKSVVGVTVVRRCVDVADLLATAATGQAAAVLLAADLRHLDREAVRRLQQHSVAVVGVVGSDDPLGEARLRQLGVLAVVRAQNAAGEIADAVRQAITDLGLIRAGMDEGPTPLQFMAGAQEAAGPGGQSGERPNGRLVAVWGPTGAPGRTTVAVTLSSELAGAGTDTLLADADTYGGAVAQALGLLDEAPGLAAAARLANAGELDLGALNAQTRQVLGRLRVLTGLVRADRWPEIRASALEDVWSLARRLAEVTVVDCGFCLEQDEEISFDTQAPRRNGATLVTLSEADLVIAVGSADPIGLQRLVRGLSDLQDVVADTPIWVVVNRVRRSSVGAHPEEQINAALARYAGCSPVTFVPYDRPAADRALLHGRTLSEVAPDSPARRALAGLAAAVVGHAVRPPRRWQRVWRRQPSSA